MSFKLSVRSLSRLKGVDPDLILVVVRAIQVTRVDFGVTEGLRTKARQQELFKQGKSKTLNSRHLIGQAVDLVAYDENGNVTWDMDYYESINVAMQRAARELGVKLTWGGSFLTFKDGPHFQIEKE